MATTSRDITSAPSSLALTVEEFIQLLAALDPTWPVFQYVRAAPVAGWSPLTATTVVAVAVAAPATGVLPVTVSDLLDQLRAVDSTWPVLLAADGAAAARAQEAPILAPLLPAASVLPTGSQHPAGRWNGLAVPSEAVIVGTLDFAVIPDAIHLAPGAPANAVCLGAA